MIKDFLL